MPSAIFMLSGGPEERLRLKSFTSTSRGAKTTLKIELVSDDPYAVAYALENLAAVAEAQKPVKPTRRQPEKPKPLALPAPARALPKPDNAG